jgi:hypothetical protein
MKVYVVIGNSYEGVGDSDSWLEGCFYSEEKPMKLLKNCVKNGNKSKLTKISLDISL